MSPQRLGVVTALAAFAADQMSKFLLLYGFGFIAMAPGQAIRVMPFFNLVMIWNRGISYGLLQAQGPGGTILLTVLSLTAIAALSLWLKGAERRWLAIGLGLIIGGALGNVIDRLLYGAVADFFHFHAFGYDWYVFNIADAAITIGVMALLLDAFFTRDSHAADREPEIRNGK